MNYNLLALFIFITISIINSFLDLKTLHISIILNYIGFTLCMIIYILASPLLLLTQLLGAMILLLIFLLIWKITNKGLGWGDIHYSIFCGLISGFPGFILSALLASLLGIVAFLIMKIRSQNIDIKKKKIPFIPMMFCGTILAIIGIKFLEPSL